MSQHIVPVRTNLTIFAALLLLLFAAIAVAYLDIGWATLPLSLAIATAKSVLIVLFFMHLRYSIRLTWVVAVAAFVWLGIMLALTMGDYLSRNWLEIPGK